MSNRVAFLNFVPKLVKSNETKQTNYEYQEVIMKEFKDRGVGADFLTINTVVSNDYISKKIIEYSKKYDLIFLLDTAKRGENTINLTNHMIKPSEKLIKFLDEISLKLNKIINDFPIKTCVPLEKGALRIFANRLKNVIILRFPTIEYFPYYNTVNDNLELFADVFKNRLKVIDEYL